MPSHTYGVFDWKRYIEYAIELSELDEKDEAKARSGISRAYYGAYNLAAKHISDEKIISGARGEGSHQTVINIYSNYKGNGDRQTIKKCHQIGESLKRLKAMRVSADYESKYFKESNGIAYANMTDELKKAVSHAKTVADQLKSLEEV